MGGNHIKLTIFPKAKSHPKTKIEKDFFSQFVSSPHQAITVEVSNENELIEIITKNAWSPFVFDKFRKQENFISTDFMVLDIDQNLQIEQAEEKCDKMGYCYLILPTVNHSETNHRFRIIFPLLRPICNTAEYKATWTYLQEHFPQLDSKCGDLARFYFASTDNDGCFSEGKLLSPTKAVQKGETTITEWKTVDIQSYEGTNILEELYGNLPERIPSTVDHFLQNAKTGLPGSWITDLNACVFTLTLQGVEQDKILSVIAGLAPEELDRRDLFHIKNAWKDAQTVLQSEERRIGL